MVTATHTTASPDQPGATVDAALVVDGLDLAFGGVRALRSVSFTADRGEICAIIGPNGAGKTSLLNCVSGLYRSDVGTIRVAGSDVTRWTPHRIADAGVARMFQNVELFNSLSVIENLLIGRHRHAGYGITAALGRLGRVRRSEAVQRGLVEDIIDFLALGGWRDVPGGQLPYGVRKRVELGRALALEPAVLLLDEPVAGMNRDETAEMSDLIRVVRDEIGPAVVLVEHDMRMVMSVADHIVVLDFGAVLAAGPPSVIRGAPAVIRAYLGSEDLSK